MRVAAASTFLVLFFVYVRCLYPAYAMGDSPETVAACLNLGIQHFPGYPLFTLLGKLAIQIPVGSPYFRVNVLVGALAASCGVSVAVLTSSWIGGRVGLLSAPLAAFTLGFSDLFWKTALSAKGGIYMLNLLLVVWMLQRLTQRRSGSTHLHRPTNAGMLLFGLGLGNHWMSIVCWIHLLIRGLTPWSTRRTFLALVFLLFGVSVYLQLPFAVAKDPMWGEPRTITGLSSSILRLDFMQHRHERPAHVIPLQLAWNIFLPLHDNGLGFFLVALAGAVSIWKWRTDVFFALYAGALLTVASVTLMTSPFQHSTKDIFLWGNDHFLLPWFMICSVSYLALLLSVQKLRTAYLRALFTGLLVFTPFMLFVENVRRNDHSQDFLGSDLAANMVSGLPKSGSLLAESVPQNFSLYGLFFVEDRLPAWKLIFTNPHLMTPWGWKRLAGREPIARELLAWGPVAGSQDDRVTTLATRLLRQGPVYYSLACAYPTLRRHWEFAGFAGKITLSDNAIGLPTESALEHFFSRLRLRGLFSTYPFKDGFILSDLDVYCLWRSFGAERERVGGDIRAVEPGYLLATKFPGLIGKASVYKSLGISYAMRDMHERAEWSFRQAVQLTPGDMDLWTNLAVACSHQGKNSSAIRYLRHALRHDPSLTGARQALSQIETYHSE